MNPSPATGFMDIPSVPPHSKTPSVPCNSKTLLLPLHIKMPSMPLHSKTPLLPMHSETPSVPLHACSQAGHSRELNQPPAILGLAELNTHRWGSSDGNKGTCREVCLTVREIPVTWGVSGWRTDDALSLRGRRESNFLAGCTHLSRTRQCRNGPPGHIEQHATCHPSRERTSPGTGCSAAWLHFH